MKRDAVGDQGDVHLGGEGGRQIWLPIGAQTALDMLNLVGDMGERVQPGLGWVVYLPYMESIVLR